MTMKFTNIDAGYSNLLVSVGHLRRPHPRLGAAWKRSRRSVSTYNSGGNGNFGGGGSENRKTGSDEDDDDHLGGPLGLFCLAVSKTDSNPSSLSAGPLCVKALIFKLSTH